MTVCEALFHYLKVAGYAVYAFQGLIAGLLAIGAAFIAARPVWKQLEELRRQHAELLGDLEPDMYIDWNFDIGSSNGVLPNVFLIVVNRHRLSINIKAFHLLMETGETLLVEHADTGNTLTGGDGNRGDSRTFTCDYRIAGRDIKDNSVKFQLLIGENCVGQPNSVAEVAVEVEYLLMANEPQQKSMLVKGRVRRAGRPPLADSRAGESW